MVAGWWLPPRLDCSTIEKHKGDSMSYRLGVDVGGTFTDLLLVNEQSGDIFTAKVPSTPHDSSIGVLSGVDRVCSSAGIDAEEITHVMHGTTVATNTILTGTGARVGLVTTKGYGQVLQIARSFVPGGLGGWVIYNKSLPLAPLALTIEADERIGAKGDVVDTLKTVKLKKDLQGLKKKGIEALTVSLINSFANSEHEKGVAKVAKEVMPDVPVSLSSDVIPEMQEYERTITTVANSYIHPKVSTYIHNLKRELKKKMDDVQLHVLRSDGGLSSAKGAEAYTFADVIQYENQLVTIEFFCRLIRFTCYPCFTWNNITNPCFDIRPCSSNKLTHNIRINICLYIDWCFFQYFPHTEAAAFKWARIFNNIRNF
jgi:N-methylhydantoinase A